MGLQAKAKMTLFASKLNCAFREYVNYRLEFSTLCWPCCWSKTI